MTEKYLPVGTVVTLNGGTKPIMIIGYFPMNEEKTVFDYNACLYPEGVIYPDRSLAFNHGDIKEIHYIGYENEETKKFNDQLKQMVQGITDLQQMKLPEEKTLENNQNSNFSTQNDTTS